MPKAVRKSRFALDAEDLKNLRESGLTDETIRANKLHTADDAMVIPYRDLQGEVNSFTRTRPHKPRIIKGKKVKYEQPKGSLLRAFYPAECVSKLCDSDTPVYLTEGEKKAMAMAQAGHRVIGLGGVWCWKKKGTDELIDDLAAIAWKGRDVYIVFDYDEKAKTRRHVDAARRRLAKALRVAGAKEVYNVELSPGPDGCKQGADDFLDAHGAETFLERIKEAKPIPRNNPSSLGGASGRTDATNAARLVAMFGDDIRWVGLWDKFLLWDGKRWKIDDHLRIHTLAKQIADNLWKEIAAKVVTGNVDRDTMKAMYGFARTSNNVSGIKAMVALSRSEPEVPIRVEDLDVVPWLLNVENGTIDLRTGKLREHRREDFITKLAPVTYDPKATCTTWIEFLDTIFAGNRELINYMKRLVGYSITCVTEEHILPFLYGSGANGKSTFCELLLKLMGTDYSMKAPPDLLMAKRGESHPTERADLFGKRFVGCIETEAGRKMAEALVKELTGGDRVRARRMREDFWEFAPTHHVWLVSNYKPVVAGTDHGIWRRIKLIPFDAVILDKEQDKKIGSKLEAELSGILNWIIKGCLEWQQNGMQEPDIVKAATTEYQIESDDIG